MGEAATGSRPPASTQLQPWGRLVNKQRCLLSFHFSQGLSWDHTPFMAGKHLSLFCHRTGVRPAITTGCFSAQFLGNKSPPPK